MTRRVKSPFVPLKAVLSNHKHITRVFTSPDILQLAEELSGKPCDDRIIVIGRHQIPTFMQFDGLANYFDPEANLAKRNISGRLGTIFGVAIYTDMFAEKPFLPNKIRVQAVSVKE